MCKSVCAQNSPSKNVHKGVQNKVPEKMCYAAKIAAYFIDKSQSIIHVIHVGSNGFILVDAKRTPSYFLWPIYLGLPR